MADRPPSGPLPAPPAGPSPTPPPAARHAGLREVLLLGAGVLITVLVAAGATALLPREGQQVVFHTPLLILVLLGGTALVLWRILRPPER